MTEAFFVSAPFLAVEMPPVCLNWLEGSMAGEQVQQSRKLLRDLAQIFGDREACSQMDPDREIYRVQWWAPVKPGEPGGLFWGVTFLHPGKVGEEYFMTHGHFHADRSRAEYYGTISGSGMLIQMDAERHTWVEPMTPGSLHYIRGENAHRMANVGETPLVVWACWGSDAGYDYEAILKHGFSARLVERDGQPTLEPGR